MYIVQYTLRSMYRICIMYVCINYCTIMRLQIGIIIPEIEYAFHFPICNLIKYIRVFLVYSSYCFNFGLLFFAFILVKTIHWTEIKYMCDGCHAFETVKRWCHNKIFRFIVFCWPITFFFGMENESWLNRWNDRESVKEIIFTACHKNWFVHRKNCLVLNGWLFADE